MGSIKLPPEDRALIVKFYPCCPVPQTLANLLGLTLIQLRTQARMLGVIRSEKGYGRIRMDVMIQDEKKYSEYITHAKIGFQKQRFIMMLRTQHPKTPAEIYITFSGSYKQIYRQ